VPHTVLNGKIERFGWHLVGGIMCAFSPSYSRGKRGKMIKKLEHKTPTKVVS